MKIYNIATLSLLAVITISFSACSDATFENGYKYITVVNCDSTVGVTPAQYTPMLSEDVLSKLVTPTKINTYLDATGNKTVCTEIGSARLLRK